MGQQQVWEVQEPLLEEEWLLGDKNANNKPVLDVFEGLQTGRIALN